MHHISRDVLVSHGKPASEVAQALNSQLRGRTVYSDGRANDYTWLSLLFDEADMTRPPSSSTTGRPMAGMTASRRCCPK